MDDVTVDDGTSGQVATLVARDILRVGRKEANVVALRADDVGKLELLAFGNLLPGLFDLRSLSGHGLGELTFRDTIAEEHDRFRHPVLVMLAPSTEVLDENAVHGEDDLLRLALVGIELRSDLVGEDTLRAVELSNRSGNGGHAGALRRVGDVCTDQHDLGVDSGHVALIDNVVRTAELDVDLERDIGKVLLLAANIECLLGLEDLRGNGLGHADGAFPLDGLVQCRVGRIDEEDEQLRALADLLADGPELLRQTSRNLERRTADDVVGGAVIVDAHASVAQHPHKRLCKLPALAVFFAGEIDDGPAVNRLTRLKKADTAGPEKQKEDDSE